MRDNSYIPMAILLALVAAAPALGTAFAQGITVATDKTDYTYGETVTITGNVGSLSAGNRVIIQVYLPNGNIYQAANADAASDGSFTYQLTTGRPTDTAGAFNVVVRYADDTQQTTFNLGSAGTTWKTFELMIENVAYPIKYQITGAGNTVDELAGDPESATLSAFIIAESDGKLTIQLPRSVVDSKDGTNDTNYVVTVDGQDAVITDDKGATVRTLSIDFGKGASEIDFIGTFVVPEFGAIAAVVLASAIVGILLATTKYGSKFSFLPKM